MLVKFHGRPVVGLAFFLFRCERHNLCPMVIQLVELAVAVLSMTLRGIVAVEEATDDHDLLNLFMNASDAVVRVIMPQEATIRRGMRAGASPICHRLLFFPNFFFDGPR